MWVKLIQKLQRYHDKSMSHDHCALLILDSYKLHKATEALKKEVSYIPGGCTSLVQLMDISVNKPFKGYIKEQWTQYMAADDTRDKTPRRNLTWQDIIFWVCTAWNLIQPEIAERSFLRCGIANALDRSEDREFSTWLKEA